MTTHSYLNYLLFNLLKCNISCLLGLWKTKFRNSRYATIKQNAIIGTTDNGRRVIQSRNYTPSQNTYSKISLPPYSITNAYLADDQGNEYYNPPPSKKRQRETREDEGGPGYVKAKGTWYRARKCHKVNSNKIHQKLWRRFWQVTFYLSN